MDLHERYVRISPIDFSILELLETAFKDNPFSLLHRLTKYYNAELIKNNLHAKQLNTFRMILCYEYQLTFNSEKKHARTVSSDLCFKAIENILVVAESAQSFIEYPVLYDIVILQLILYCNPQCIVQHLVNFQKSNDALNNSESKFFYIKILECFLESLQLKKFICCDLEPNLLEYFSSLYVKDIVLWLQMNENKEWQLFASILPKLVNTCGPENVLPCIWFCILNKLDDVKDCLSALSILIDVCFLSNSENISLIYYNLCYTEQLWSLIIQSIKSPVQQYRKQALFIMKKITDFTNTIDKSTLKLKKHEIIPFICNQSIKTKISINEIKQTYFLILDALEEKQHHLILPALTHLPTLIKGSKEHDACNNCFSKIWLQLIFVRMLQHENNAILKQGILYVCKLPDLMYDINFLQLFIHVLNNTFLYESQAYQQKPEILNDIITLFTHTKEKEEQFFNKVLLVISEEIWAPIPLFYIMKILRTVSSKMSNHWKDDELVLVKFLMQKNLNMHSHILRIASQIELLKTVSLSVKEIKDLKIVIDTLSEFPSKEALRRNSFSWDIVVKWLKEVLEEANVINFLQFMCNEYSCEDPYLRLNSTKFALVVMMLYDTDLISQHTICPIGEILNNWLSSLKGIDTRPYANIVHTFYMVEFLSHLLHLSVTKMHNSTMQLLSSYTDDALKFLLKNSKNIAYKFNYEEITRYLATIVSFFDHGNLILSEKEILTYAEKFKHESISILQNAETYTNMHFVCALYILYHTQNILCRNQKLFDIQLLLNICLTYIPNNHKSEIKSNEKGEKSAKGKIASNCYVLLARLINQFLSRVEIQLWPQEIDWFKNISYLYEVGGSEIVPEIALILKIIVSKGIKYPENKLSLESIFTTCWRTTLLNTKNKIYFSAMKNLVGVIINNNFLVLPNTMNFVNNFLDQLLEEGDNVSKLKKILLNEMELLDVCYLKNLQEPLLSCLLHGHVLKKDKQIENQTYLYIAKNYQNCYPQHIQIIDYNNEATIRATSVVLLHKIINEDKTFASKFLPIILQKLEKYKNKRYFNYSYIHKIKHRIMQILLIIQPVLTKEDNIILQEFLCNAILLESNQHSVRLMQEWILIQIFSNNIDLHDKLWEYFEKGIATRPGCVSSIACIVYHISKLLSKDLQSNFILMGIKYIAHCCLGQQYNMRLHSQIIFVKLYNMLERLNCDYVTLEYKGLYDAAVTSLKGGLAKNTNRIQDDIYLSTFHPLEDYSLQTIYFELPRLTDMDTSEWISPDLFKILQFKKINNHPLQLYNLDASLSNTKTSSYLTKSTGDTELLKNYNIDFEQLSDIQKKINPSMSINVSYTDIFPTIRESISHKRISLNEEGLIVVASLVSRIPNLGGLARTCEIFNVKELVIANLNQIKDKEFRNLSVSAENWITITETKPHELCRYLLDKKDMGWFLVGLEQTANSTNLQNMKFKKKTILVLGNEKDGIPANLIPLFDTCIEIPQIGIIRSLNVHVSGAICIWQYAKQHILI